MKYMFRKNLSKTVVHKIVSEFAKGVQLPSIRRCEFKRYAGTYWLRFYAADAYYKATLSSAFGSVYVRMEQYDFDKDQYSQMAFEKVPFDYLLENGYLQGEA